MPVRRMVRATYVALGHTHRAAIGANAARPRQPPDEFLGEQQTCRRAIENIEKAVPVGMQQKLSILSAKLGVHEDVGLVRIPIANIVRRELVVPLQFSGGGIERQDAVGEQIVAASLAIVGIRPRIAGGPDRACRSRDRRNRSARSPPPPVATAVPFQVSKPGSPLAGTVQWRHDAFAGARLCRRR